ncbi:MAG: PKD domain-containing protein [Solirubrobacteraceae bacterium]
MLVTAASISVAFGTGIASADAGSVVPGFGNSGYAFQSFGQGAQPLSAGISVAVAPDGDIYQAGAVGQTTNPNQDQLYIARYTPNGALDPSFGIGGVTYENVGDGSSPTTATPTSGIGGAPFAGGTVVKLTPGGDPVVATTASAGTSSGDTQVAVLEFTQSGRLDTAFNSTGVHKLDLATDTIPGGMTIDSGGNIVLTGAAGSSTSDEHFFAARLTSSGTLDPGFGANGVAHPAIVGTSNTEGTDVIAQSNGDLVFTVAGATLLSDPAFALLRLDGDGAPDSSFGLGGLAVAQVSTGTPQASEAFSLVATSDGGYAVTGFGVGGELSVPSIAVAEFSLGGQLDTSFGTGGSTISEGGAIGSVGTGILTQPDGKLLVTAPDLSGLMGPTGLSTTILRLDANGTPDPNFGGAGLVSLATPPDVALSIGLGSALTPDGNLVVTGLGETGPGTGSPLIGSLLQEISLDTAPTLVTAADTGSVQAGTPVHFVAAAVSPDGESLGQISWDLGSGSFGAASGSTATTTFTTPGTYMVRADVTDAFGLSTISTQTVTVTAAPAPTPASPSPSPSPSPSTSPSTSTSTSVTPAQVFAPTLKLVRVRVLKGRVKVTLMCAFAGCKVNASLTTHVIHKDSDNSASLSAGGHGGSAVRVGAAKLSMRANQTRTFTIRLNKAGRRLLMAFHSIPATASFKLTDSKRAKVIHHKVRIH